MSRFRNYLKRHHLALIAVGINLVAIAVAIVLVPWGLLLEQRANAQHNTSKYFFVPERPRVVPTSLNKADCWYYSLSSMRSDAYRCAVDNTIYDPCFLNFDDSHETVACPETPTGTIEYFQFTTSIPKSDERRPASDSSNLEPWYVALSNGNTCRMLTGMSDFVADHRVDYFCSEDKTYLQLPVEQVGTELQIRCYNPNTKVVELCSIRDAWF